MCLWCRMLNSCSFYFLSLWAHLNWTRSISHFAYWQEWFSLDIKQRRRGLPTTHVWLGVVSGRMVIGFIGHELLDASPHLHKQVRGSVRPSALPYIRPSVCPLPLRILAWITCGTHLIIPSGLYLQCATRYYFFFTLSSHEIVPY